TTRDSASSPPRPSKTIFAAPDKPSIVAGPQRVSPSAEPRTSPNAAGVRAGEYLAAPWIAPALPPDRGRIVRSGDVPGIPLTESLRSLQMREQVFVRAPRGTTPQVGDRYVVVRADDEIDRVGQVLVPTGVVVVDRVTGGADVDAHIAAAYEELAIG